VRLLRCLALDVEASGWQNATLGPRPELGPTDASGLSAVVKATWVPRTLGQEDGLAISGVDGVGIPLGLVTHPRTTETSVLGYLLVHHLAPHGWLSLRVTRFRLQRCVGG
jgi:hypothetical protein